MALNRKRLTAKGAYNLTELNRSIIQNEQISYYILNFVDKAIEKRAIKGTDYIYLFVWFDWDSMFSDYKISYNSLFTRYRGEDNIDIHVSIKAKKDIVLIDICEDLANRNFNVEMKKLFGFPCYKIEIKWGEVNA